MRPSRGFLLVAVTVAATVGFAVWNDLLPGGWTLRGWFVDPRERANETYRRDRERRLREFADELETAPRNAVIFIGSSTIERFELARFFASGRALNRGIGDEPLDDLRERWTVGVPEDAAAFVIYAGSVDFRRRGTLLEALERGVDQLVASIRAGRPDAEIVLLGLLSERDATPAIAAELAKWNVALERIAREHGARWIPLDRAPLRTNDGRLTEAFSCDRLHLSAEGYAVVARWILDEGGAIARMLAP